MIPYSEFLKRYESKYLRLKDMYPDTKNFSNWLESTNEIEIDLVDKGVYKKEGLTELESSLGYYYLKSLGYPNVAKVKGVNGIVGFGVVVG